MSWMEDTQKAINYIEDNLLEVSAENAANYIYSSSDHFQRMFLIVTGFTVSEYIRNRKLSLAGRELVVSSNKVIDIALKYGYSSPTAFNRAFQNQHKVSPKYARSRKVPLVSYPRISLLISIKGVAEMKVKIEQKPAFSIVGVKKKSSI